MLKSVIEATMLDPGFCAGLVGVSPEQFNEWLAGKPVPRFARPELAAILGVAEPQISNDAQAAQLTDTASLLPAIWYKLRGDRLIPADREMVGLVRKLGGFMEQLAIITGTASRAYAPVVASSRADVPKNAPPASQGRQAARAFRELTNIAHGQTAIGDLIRPVLRRLGLLVVESPIKSSNLEGLAFLVGPEGRQRPCIFINSYQTTWFRRNALLLHELAHVIFDVFEDQVAVDYKESNDRESFEEQRADVFAQECLVPKPFLLHLTNLLGVDWHKLTEEGLARVVASSHVEKRLVIKAAIEAGLITADESTTYSAYDIGDLLRSHSDHALSTREYLRKMNIDSPVWRAENRKTDGIRRMRLPAGYVDLVLKAAKADSISENKAAEMLMIEPRTYRKRYGGRTLV